MLSLRVPKLVAASSSETRNLLNVVYVVYVAGPKRTQNDRKEGAHENVKNLKIIFY